MDTATQVNEARARLTDYMLNARYDEPDGLIHRSGIIAAVLDIPREIVDEVTEK